MLTNFEIEDIADNLKLGIIGVFSKNQLPHRRAVGSYYVNLQDAEDGDGTHWVFFKIFDDAKAIYFDSFGLPPPQDINKFLLPFKPVASNNRQIQDLKSEMCGWFCIACDYYLTYDVDKKRKDIFECYDDFLNIWSIDKKKNDTILKEYLKIK
jgi:hypothetical protein